MTPEEIIAREEARLGRRLNPEEKGAIRAGATSVSTASPDVTPDSIEDVLTPARRAALEAVETRRRGEETMREHRSWDTARDATAGAIEGATMGFADELHGAMENPMGAALATGRLLGADAPATGEAAEALEEYDRARDELRAVGDEASERSPWAYGGGALAGGLATAPFTPALRVGSAATTAARAARAGGTLTPALTRAARLEGLARVGGAAATGAGYGALGGAGASDEDDILGVLGDTAGGAVGGAVTGGALGVAGEGLGSLGNAALRARESAMTRALAVPGGTSTSAARLIDDLGGGEPGVRGLRRAWEAYRSAGVDSPLATPADIAARGSGARSPGPAEAAMAATPRGDIDPDSIAAVLEAEVSRFANPEERARRAALTRYAEGLRAMGRAPGEGRIVTGPAGPVPDFIPSGGRASPPPAERMSVPDLSGPPPPAPAVDRAAGTPPGRGGGRRARGGTVAPEAVDPDAIPRDLLTPDPPAIPGASTYPDFHAGRAPMGIGRAGAAVDMGDEAVRAAVGATWPSPTGRRGWTRGPDGRPVPFRTGMGGYSGEPALPAGLSPEPGTLPPARPTPEPAPAVTRPAGSRPLGAREMSGSWAEPPPPVAERRALPFSGTGPTDRPPDSAMHVLDVMDERGGYNPRAPSTDPSDVMASWRRARHGVRGLYDDRIGETLGPEALAEHVRTRRDARVMAPILREAEEGARRMDTSGSLADVGMGIGSGLAGSMFGLPGAHSLPLAIGAGLASAAGRRAVRGRGPAIMASGTEALARFLESPPVSAVAREAPGAAAAVTPTAARGVGAGVAEDEPAREPLPIPPPIRRRPAPAEAPPTATPSRGSLPIPPPIRRRRRAP
jgi:hypothetical protein